MNKTITAAYNAAITDKTEQNLKALADLAVPKFKDVYGRVQKAVRTVNRHLGVNKGTPNRATMATAIGLKGELKAFREVGNLIEMNEMIGAANIALDTIDKIAEMRKTRQYDHIDVLADFYTDAEKAERKAVDAKIYLYNITNAARAAIDTINRHIVDGTFDVNTFKIAKVVGYKDELDALKADLDAAPDTIVTDADKTAFDALKNAFAAIDESFANDYKTAVPALNAYDPFPEPTDEENLTEGEENGNGNEENEAL